ncbi:MAG: S41 family peptidase [Synechococcus sp.]
MTLLFTSITTIIAVAQQSARWLKAGAKLLPQRQLFLVMVVLLSCFNLTACQPRPSWGEEQKLLAQVWTTIDRAYVDPTFNQQDWWEVRQTYLRQPMSTPYAAYQQIEAMLSTLEDPFTRFLPPANYRSLQTSTAGELNGVGLQIAMDNAGTIRVIAPLEGTPADRAGLQPDDRILTIDDIAVDSWTLDEVANHLRGAANTSVYLKLERDDREFEVKLKREAIEINPVRSKIIPRAIDRQNVAYIRLNQFNGNAVSEMQVAIDRAEAQSVAGYVLDLRGNPGGLLRAGIEIAQMWINEGPIVYTIDRNGISDSADATATILTDKPMVVLVNKGTASAAEVLAGAIQDSGRGLLVGTRTFGKGLIQSLFDMPDGAGLAVTVAKYATPSGRDINRLGIEPNYLVSLENNRTLERKELATERDPQFTEALEVLRQQLTLPETAI